MHASLRRLIAVGFLALIACVGLAVGTGRVAYVVTNGVSMQPVYHGGDLVVVARARSYHRGQIVAYHAPQPGHDVTLHRIIGGDSSGFVIKGDNNQSVDVTRPTAKQLIGRAVVHVPKVGTVLESPISRGLVALLVLVLLAGLMLSPRANEVGVHAWPSGTSRHPLWKGIAILDVLLLVAVALTFVLAPPPVPPARKLTQTGVLRYHAEVAVSDTYPTGAVVTGDPVFVRLLDHVGVSFRYGTDAPTAAIVGTARLDVVRSLANGWHSSLPLVAPTPLTAGSADMSGTLDLARLQALAASVAKETGVGAGTLSVIVVASVTVSVDGTKPATYTSQLPFQLTPLELALSGAKPTTSPQGPAIVSDAPLELPVPRPLHQARTLSHRLRLTLLTLLALGVGATVVVWPSPAPAPAEDDDEEGAQALLDGPSSRPQAA